VKFFKIITSHRMVFTGIECYKNQIVPINISTHLIQPLQLISSRGDEVQCALWRSGQFSERVSSVSPSIIQIKERIPSYNVNYSFIQEKWQYKNEADKQFSVPWMHSSQFRSHLIGAHFLFQGDSMIRQIFSRIIHHIRGYNVFTERILHCNAMYSYNSSHDLYSVDRKEVSISCKLFSVRALIDLISY